MRAEIDTQALESDFFIKICYGKEPELISNERLELQCYKRFLFFQMLTDFKKKGSRSQKKEACITSLL